MEKQEAHLRKINENRKGKTYIEIFGESKARDILIKKSLAMKGKYPPFKGHKHNEDTKKLMSLRKLGKYEGSDNPMFGKNRDDLKAFNELRKGKKFEEIYGKTKATKLKNHQINFMQGKTMAKGMKHTDEWKFNHSRKMLGAGNPSWLNGVSFEPYSSEFNKAFKQAIILRDNNCLVCGSNNQLHVHHINYNKLESCKENCICLCRSCHSKTNFNREQWKDFCQSLLSSKYGYKYQNGKVLVQLNADAEISDMANKEVN